MISDENCDPKRQKPRLTIGLLAIGLATAACGTNTALETGNPPEALAASPSTTSTPTTAAPTTETPTTSEAPTTNPRLQTALSIDLLLAALLPPESDTGRFQFVDYAPEDLTCIDANIRSLNEGNHYILFEARNDGSDPDRFDPGAGSISQSHYWYPNAGPQADAIAAFEQDCVIPTIGVEQLSNSVRIQAGSITIVRYGPDEKPFWIGYQYNDDVMTIAAYYPDKSAKLEAGSAFLDEYTIAKAVKDATDRLEAMRTAGFAEDGMPDLERCVGWAC